MLVIKNILERHDIYPLFQIKYLSLTIYTLKMPNAVPSTVIVLNLDLNIFSSGRYTS